MNRETRPLSPTEIDAQAADWIVRRDSGLSRPEQVEFARWQAADARHAEAVARHDQAWILLDRPRVAGRAGEMARALPARVARRRRRRLGVAATALALLLGALTPLWWPSDLSSSAPAPGSSVVLLPSKQTLPDGSVVELKDGAEITVAYGDRVRRVMLQGGEALFQVEKDTDRPFVVTAGGVDVRAVGTIFLVQWGGSQLDVIVTEGRVAIEKSRERDDAAPGDPLVPPADLLPPPAAEFSTLVDAGARLTIDTAGAPARLQAVTISAAEIAARLAWRAPFLEFTEVPLAEAVAMFNQYSTVRLVVDDPALATLPVNGRFRADNSETLVRLLQSNLGVKASREDGSVILRRAAGAP